MRKFAGNLCHTSGWILFQVKKRQPSLNKCPYCVIFWSDLYRDTFEQLVEQQRLTREVIFQWINSTNVENLASKLVFSCPSQDSGGQKCAPLQKVRTQILNRYSRKQRSSLEPVKDTKWAGDPRQCVELEHGLRQYVLGIRKMCQETWGDGSV